MQFKTIEEIPRNQIFFVHGYENGDKSIEKIEKFIEDVSTGFNYKTFTFNPLKKYTLCGILDNGKIYLGLTVCTKVDVFSRKIGRSNAFNKAIESHWLIETDITDPKEIRNMLNTYVNMYIEYNLYKFKNFHKYHNIIELELNTLKEN